MRKARSMRFDRAKPERQVEKVMKQIRQYEKDRSAKRAYLIGTNRDYSACLLQFTRFVQENRLGDLRHAKKETALRYLRERSGTYRQKTLDMARQALQTLFLVTGELRPGERLEVVRSTVETKLGHRAYTEEQVRMVEKAQSSRNAFSTRLAAAAGLRAHELFTLRPLSEQPASLRRYADGSVKSLPTKWAGRERWARYSVVGKGGLVREVRLPQELAKELEKKRFAEPQAVSDRGVRYWSAYDLAGGQAWSNSFSSASKRAVGWSTGAHGLRHAYAQDRYREISRICGREKALETVSQEMGHFRPDITLVYMR